MGILKKTALLTFFVGLVLSGVSFFSLSAHAQVNTIGTSTSANTQGATQNPSAANASSGGLFSCVPFLGSAFGGESATSCLIDAVGAAILTFANFLLGVAGVLFNLVMVYGVFQFANTIGNASGVLTAWGILRDLANMALLFGFIFMGVATILDTGAVQGFTAKNALPKLLIFAVLMNFSLFTCEAMIDVSNALASTMYSQANTDPCIVSGTDQTADCGLNYGLAGHIMQSTGLAGIWANRGTLNIGVTEYLGLALFATIGAIVFFAASIMLAIRLIILTFLMIVSPIGFAGMAIPPLQRFAGDWWQRVIHQAFYAPIMLLLILISLKISDVFTSNQANNGLSTQVSASLASATTDPNASSISVILIFMLVIGFMVASLIIANRFGAAGATAAVGFGKKIVLGSYGAAAGFAGRRTIGAGSNWAQKQYKSNTTLRRLGVATRLDSGIIKVTEAGKNEKFGSNASFADKDKQDKERKHALENLDRLDAVKKARNADEMTKALKQVGEGQLPDLIAQMKSNTQQLKLFALSLPADKFDKLINNKEYYDEHAKQEMTNLRYEDLAAVTKTAADAAAAYFANPADTALKSAYEDAQKALGAEAKALSKKDASLIASSSHSNLFEDATFAAALSDDLFKSFKDDGQVPATMRTALEEKRNARFNDVNYVALNVPAMRPDDINKIKSAVLSDSKVLGKMSGRQLAKLDLENVTDQEHIDKIVKHVSELLTSPNLSPEDQKKRNDFTSQIIAVPKYHQRWAAEGVSGIG